MQINTLNEFLENYIEGYLLKDLFSVKENVPGDAHPGNAAYLITGAICSGIDFLGSLVTDRVTTAACEHCGKPEHTRSKFPFEHYCKYYLSQVDPRYTNLGPVLRELIRNGIAHSFATKGKVGITRVSDSHDDLHLVKMTKEGFLVLHADRFYDDFKKSYAEFYKPELASNPDKNAKALENYEHMRASKEIEIERTMRDVKNKLNDWPLLYSDVDYLDHMVDEVEAHGELPLIS